ncbi:MAG: hypothetical protein PHW13_05895 [Methylococcales bacterium]|nr:hypothetical protein [Methylococcales bacterium]
MAGYDTRINYDASSLRHSESGMLKIAKVLIDNALHRNRLKGRRLAGSLF